MGFWLFAGPTLRPQELLSRLSARSKHRAHVVASTSMKFSLLGGEQRRQNAPRMNNWVTTIATLLILLATLARAEDFKTVNGKVYKDATVTRIEADGIELRTKTGIFKVYFAELPQDIQERFHWVKPDTRREPFYGRWVAAAEDPAVLAKIIAAAAAVVASVGLVINYIRFRRRPKIATRRVSRRKAVDRARG